MTRSILGTWLVAATVSAHVSAVQAESKPYTLDLGHAYVGWEIDHFGYSNTVGQFREFDGEFLIDGEQLENSNIRFTIQTASIYDDIVKTTQFTVTVFSITSQTCEICNKRITGFGQFIEERGLSDIRSAH